MKVFKYALFTIIVALLVVRKWEVASGSRRCSYCWDEI